MAEQMKTQSVQFDPLGDATRQRAEIKMTGAQLMDLVDERDALRAALVALVKQTERIYGEMPGRAKLSWVNARLLLDGRVGVSENSPNTETKP